MIPGIKPRATQQPHHAVLEQSEAKAPQSSTRNAAHMGRWSTRRRRDAWFLLIILLMGIVMIFVLSGTGGRGTGQANRTPSVSSPTPITTASAESGTQAAVAIAHPAQMRLYPFPSNVGLMQPAIDTQGNVWVGEMYANRFARLNSRTGIVTTWEPPNGKYGIMTATVDAHGNIWFVEQGANYIGRFDPARQTFQTFSIGTVNGHPMGPQDLQFDASGRLWFTALSNGRIGRLDPTTGTVQTWPVPAPRAGISASPFSLTVTPMGQVWFGDLTGGTVGYLDPATGRVTLYRLADPQAQVFSMASDARGRIWFTEILSGKLGMIDPSTAGITELPVPTMLGNPAALYGLVVAHNGDVWFVNNGARALVRYAPGNATYTFFPLSLPSGAPYGLTLDAAGRLWFTAAGSSADYVGVMTP